MKDLMKKYPRVVDLDTGNQSISSNQPEEEDIVFSKKIKLEGKWSLFKTSNLCPDLSTCNFISLF